MGLIPARTATHTAVITRTVTTLGSPWKGDLQESLWLCFSTTTLGGTSGQNRASLQEEHQTNQGLEQKHLPLTPRTRESNFPSRRRAQLCEPLCGATTIRSQPTLSHPEEAAQENGPWLGVQDAGKADAPCSGSRSVFPVQLSSPPPQRQSHTGQPRFPGVASILKHPGS